MLWVRLLGWRIPLGKVSVSVSLTRLCYPHRWTGSKIRYREVEQQVQTPVSLPYRRCLSSSQHSLCGFCVLPSVYAPLPHFFRPPWTTLKLACPDHPCLHTLLKIISSTRLHPAVARSCSCSLGGVGLGTAGRNGGRTGGEAGKKKSVEGEQKGKSGAGWVVRA